MCEQYGIYVKIYISDYYISGISIVISPWAVIAKRVNPIN
jgi:hypothetical protein